jgi:predicted ATP-grasp superfamily ATP-dependent carboligase
MNIPDEEFDEIIDLEELFSPAKEADPLIMAEKVTGDRVTIYEISGTGTMDGKILSDDEMNSLSFIDVFIVIATGQDFRLKEKFRTYHQDLVLFLPRTGRKYRSVSLKTRLLW